MRTEQHMKKVWTEFPCRVGTGIVHRADRVPTFSIPKISSRNTLIEQANPELSRSGGSPVSY
jgi:hypothetical protein